MMQTVARPITVLIMILMLALLLPTLALAADGETQGCPQPIGAGVVCTGPTVPPNYLPAVHAQRACPQPVGQGVICTGPEIPPGEPAAEGQPSTPMMPVGLYLPMINR